MIGSGVLKQQAAHDAIVASGRHYCSTVQTDPAVLCSNTFCWPAVADSIVDSITSMEKSQAYWTGLTKVAPKGIRAETNDVVNAAAGIIASVKATRVLDDADNVSRMQRVAAHSGIPAWVSKYCE